MVLCTPHQVAEPLLLLLCSLGLDGQGDFLALLQPHDVHLLVVANLNTRLLQINPIGHSRSQIIKSVSAHLVNGKRVVGFQLGARLSRGPHGQFESLEREKGWHKVGLAASPEGNFTADQLFGHAVWLRGQTTTEVSKKWQFLCTIVCNAEKCVSSLIFKVIGTDKK
jgi:predicted dithiol-disulfide oxidoreductase (DUF899 family)